MDSSTIVSYMAYGMLGISPVVLYMLVAGEKSYYGRYAGEGGIMSKFPINGKAAWILQEAPCVLMGSTFLYRALTSNAEVPLANYLLCGLFMTHYVHRTFIFPLRLRGGKPTPIVIFLMAMGFCFYNGFMQMTNTFDVAQYASNYISSPSFLLGTAVFFTGMAINIHSDVTLINLRKPGETGYKIPKGGMFEYVSGANFFGEIVEWGGYAIASGSLPAFAFFVFTACNIGPRALHHHQWYLTKFKDEYPKSRKALIPFLL